LFLYRPVTGQNTIIAFFTASATSGCVVPEKPLRFNAYGPKIHLTREMIPLTRSRPAAKWLA
jgi:hypothetical protein